MNQKIRVMRKKRNITAAGLAESLFDCAQHGFFAGFKISYLKDSETFHRHPDAVLQCSVFHISFPSIGSCLCGLPFLYREVLPFSSVPEWPLS